MATRKHTRSSLLSTKKIEESSYGSVNTQPLEGANITDGNLVVGKTQSRPLCSQRNKLRQHNSAVRGQHLHTSILRKTITSKKVQTVSKSLRKVQKRKKKTQMNAQSSVYLASLDLRKSTSFGLKGDLSSFQKRLVSVYLLNDILVERTCTCSGQNKKGSNVPPERSEEQTGNLPPEGQPIAQQNCCRNRKSCSPERTLKKKRKTLQNMPDSIFYKDHMPFGALDDETIRQHQMDVEFYRAQNCLINPPHRQSKRQDWYYRLLIKHVLQKWLNPIDTFQATRYAQDEHGPPLGRVEWRRGQPRGWACGCPAQPCICHFGSEKPPAMIPKSYPHYGTDSPRLLDRVAQRVRIEERLHEKMEDFPPPCGQPIENLFGLGLMPPSVEQQLMKGPLVAASERARCESILSILRRKSEKPEEQICGTIGYKDTIKTMREEGANEVIADQGYDIEEKKKEGDADELQFIEKKCEEIRKDNSPFPTRAICYRVEEERASGLRASRNVEASARAGGTGREGRSALPAAPPASLLSVLTSKRPRIGAALRPARCIDETKLRRQHRRAAKLCPESRIADFPAGTEKSENHQATHVCPAEDCPPVLEATRRKGPALHVEKQSSHRTSQYVFVTDSYKGTLKMMREEGANEINAKHPQGYDIEEKKNGGDGDDLQFIEKKCEEIRKDNSPFPTRAICYRVEEERASWLRASRNVEASARAGGTGREGRGALPATPPTSILTVLTSKRPRIGAALRPARRIDETKLRRQHRRAAKLCPELRIADIPAGTEKSENHQATHVSPAEDCPPVLEATRRKGPALHVEKQSSHRTSQYVFVMDRLEHAPTEEETIMIIDEKSENCAATALAPAPKNASQSTSELTSSIVRKNKDMNPHRQGTRWEIYRQSFNNFYKSLKDITKSLDPGSGAWKTKNFKYWFCSCWSNTNSVRRNRTHYNVPNVDDLYPHLAQLIQEEKRYRDVLLLHKYLVETDMSN